MAVNGKVTNILNARELVINRGSDAGVQLDMVFKVMEDQVEITDPDTRIRLGTLEREKIRIKITEIQPKFAIGRTYETYQTNDPGFSALSHFGVFAPRRITRVRTLKTQDENIAIGDENIAAVSPGDPVVQIAGESNSAIGED